MIEIPLRNRAREVVAVALIDDEDAHLALYRWSPNGAGYAFRNVRLGSGRKAPQRAYLLHREVLGLQRGDGTVVDHINRDKLDCRRANLRIGTRALNQQNRGSDRGSASRFRGVSWEAQTQRWRASVTLGGVTYRLGRFDSEEEAAAVASDFRAQHMPFAVETSV